MPIAFFKELEMTKLKKHQQLLHFYYMNAFQNHYRKDGDCLYQPKYNRMGQFTYSYEYVFDISDFVFQSLFPIEQNQYWFECLTDKGNNASVCTASLTNIKSEWLPDLVRNPDIHSFENGLFVISANTFFYFKKTPGKRSVDELNGNLMAIKYHNIVFDEQGMEDDMARFPTRHYMGIDMPYVHQILDTQNFSTAEREWIFALLGRLLTPLGKRDAWGVFPYFLGLAGTGKSTCLRLVASLLEARDVGYLNNTLQKTFALEGIFDKILYLALDIDEYFQLDQATFQSMVVGEEVSVLRKFKRPLTKLWDIHGGFAGNKLPPWQDNGGSLSRRLIVIEFQRLVTKCDPQLFEKCLDQRDRFLYVISSAYKQKSNRYRTRGIKEVLPDKFRNSEKKALMELNCLLSFVTSTCDIDEADPGNKTYIQPFKAFNQCFKDFCKRGSIKPKALNYSFYSSVFAKFQITVEEPESKNDDPFGQDCKYILGLKLKDKVIEQMQEDK